MASLLQALIGVPFAMPFCCRVCCVAKRFHITPVTEGRPSRRRADSTPGRGCQLDIVLVSEILAEDALQILFPINLLRDIALLASRTELVLLGDADLLAGSSLNKALEDRSGYAPGHDSFGCHDVTWQRCRCQQRMFSCNKG